MADLPIPPPAAAALSTPIPWIAPAEAQRAKQLLDTHPHLLTANKALDWLPNPALLAHAQAHSAAVATKAGLAATRPAQTVDMNAVVQKMKAPLTELRGVMKKEFKEQYEAYYPQFGLVKSGKNWQLPDDRDELLQALGDFLLPALTKYGFQADPDTGTAVWQPLRDQLAAGLAAAAATDAARSIEVGTTNPQDEKTEKALRCLYHLALAHYPDNWESVLRGWGWRKTSF